jgi:1-aminocyclopropane-1-carboxylate deaminase/D-cysteine desulfhydrase-like pyridoxal-dependent ACC family enzyme
MYKIDDITPIEEYNNIYYKRDDLYTPFLPEPLNGGKVRQCITLIQSNLERIKTEHGGVVATITSINSPQGIIVSRVCKEFGLRCIIGVGGQGINNNKICDEIRKNGGEIITLSRMAYDNVLYSKLKDLEKETGSNYFKLKLGINVGESAEMRDSIANQVVNVPEDTQTIIIPTGSGIIGGSVLYGLKQLGRNHRVIIVQIAGYDRTKTINNICSDYPYEYIAYDKYPYSKKLKIFITPTFQLDTVYESKGYDWMLNNIDTEKEKTLFWCVGNASMYR